MQTTKVGIREFCENLSSYLESKTPVVITRHGATIGIYVPTRPKPNQADLEALRVAGEKMQELIAAALGSRVLCLLRKYAGHVEFLAPDTAFQEAREWLPGILERRKVPVAPATMVLELVAGLVQTVESETYSQFEALARERISRVMDGLEWDSPRSEPSRVDIMAPCVLRRLVPPAALVAAAHPYEHWRA